MSAEKRSLDQEEFSSVIVDIEGTTTSISFVHDTLFPYVREHLTNYVESNWAEKIFQEDLEALKQQAKKDESDKIEGVIAIPEGDDETVRQATIKNVLWQMDNDRKTAALKQLQGHIWKKAYESGKVVGHIYDDVHESLKTWVDLGKKIYVYSSGSVEAQKLLFGHTKNGDLLNLFSGHFDTAVGPKTEAASYVKILEKIEKTGKEAKTVLFLTDVPKEAAAAVEAGMLAVLVARDGNAPLSDDDKAAFQVITSFADLVSNEGKCKRRKISETDDSKAQNNDVEMKQVDDDSKQKSNEESAKKEVDSTTESSMDTSEVAEQAKKEESAVEKPVVTKENDSEEKTESATEKSNDDTDKSTSNDEISKSDETKEKEIEEVKESTTAEVESIKVDANDKVEPESTESVTEKQESASDEKDSKAVIAQNGSVDEVEKEKVDESVQKQEEEEDKSAKLEAVENNTDVNDDSGIADVNKSVIQSEKSDDAKADDEKIGETVAKEGDAASTDVKAEDEKSAETTKSEIEAAESKDELKNGEADKATDEKKVNGSAVADTNGCEAAQNGDGAKELQNGKEAKELLNGDEAKKHQNGDAAKEHLNGGDMHDETENSKTDQANANQKSIEEKKLETSVNNATETVAV